MFVASIFCAVLSALCNGSFGTLSKFVSVHPYVFNFWTCLGISVSSIGIFLVASLFGIGEHSSWIFEPWALLSGLFFVVSTANAFMAIGHIGLSVGSGVWCGTAVLVSFSYGVLVNHEPISNTPLALVSLAILIAGITGIAYAGHTSRRPFPDPDDSEAPLLTDAAEREEEAVTRVLAGLISAMIAGSFGGLILAPMSFAPEEHQGLQFLPSMGLGVLVAAPFITMSLIYCIGFLEPPPFAPREAAGPGVLSGTIWNIGNAASIIAVRDPAVGLAVAYPIMQCGLAVAGLWGVLAFGEIRGRAQALYWTSSVVLICGASLLALAKGSP